MLTREQQRRELSYGVRAYRELHAQMFGYLPGTTGTVASFRRALRLDDIKLTLIIEEARATGRKLEWTSEVAACPQS